MNFDSKAYVRNITADTFISQHGYAFVRDNKNNNIINYFSFTKDKETSFVTQYNTNENDINYTNILYNSSSIPHTVQVYNETIKELKEIKFNIIRDSRKHNSQDFDYKTEKIYISSIQPTNIKYNPQTAIVYDTEKKETTTIFSGVSVNVNNKTEVIIPEKVNDYTNLSLVIQKNSFTEIKLPENISNIVNLPEELTYTLGYIKGTFTKSGEYNIKIEYPDGEQIINIIVPYYQRLL